MHIRRAVGWILAAPLLLLTACAGEDAEADPPPTSPSPTAPSSTASHPPKPETPEAFIRRWVALDRLMQNTGETAEFLAISHGCAPCQRVAKTVRGIYAAGGYVRWGGWRIESISRYAQGAKGTIWKVPIRSAPTTYRRAEKAGVERLPGGRSIELLTLRRDGRSWQLTNMAELPS